MNPASPAGGTSTSYSSQSISDYVDPTALMLALEFLSRNSKEAAMGSLLGKTASVVSVLRKREILINTLSSPGALNDALQNKFPQLIDDMRSMGLSFPSNPPSTSSFSNVSGWLSSLRTGQLQDMEVFRQIQQEVGGRQDLLKQFVRISGELLDQLTSVQMQNRNNVDLNPIDIIRSKATRK